MLAHTHDHAVSLHIGSYPPIYSLYGALWSSYKRARFLHVSKVLSDTPVTYSSTLHYTHNPVIELTAVHLCAGKPGVAHAPPRQQCFNLFHQCFTTQCVSYTPLGNDVSTFSPSMSPLLTTICSASATASALSLRTLMLKRIVCGPPTSCTY